MYFLEAVGGQSLIDPNSGKSDTAFALISILIIYLIWSKVRSKKGKPFPCIILSLVSGGLMLIYALLYSNFIFLHIAVSFCAISVFRIFYSFYAKRAKKEPATYYPSFWTSFVIYYILFNLVTMSLCVYFLLENSNYNAFVTDGTPLYVLSCPFSLIVSFFITILYFLPYSSAQKHNHPKTRTVYLLNTFAGWTIIGWVLAIFIVYYKPKAKAKVKPSKECNITDENMKYKELYEYKTLYDNGIISSEEFEAKKKQILDL